MVTGISFAFFRLAGDRLQHYKNDAGTVPLRGLDEVTMVIAWAGTGRHRRSWRR